MALGILILRLAIALVAVAHGTQKLFGWFSGGGLEATGRSLEEIGLRPGRLHAILAGSAEMVGGVLLATGLLTPLGVAAIVGVMAGAVGLVHLRNGFFAHSGGYEYPLLLGLAALAVGFGGPGAWSLDHVIGWSLSGLTWGLGALALGLVGADAVVLTRWLSSRPGTRAKVAKVVRFERRGHRRLAA